MLECVFAAVATGTMARTNIKEVSTTIPSSPPGFATITTKFEEKIWKVMYGLNMLI